MKQYFLVMKQYFLVMMQCVPHSSLLHQDTLGAPAAEIVTLEDHCKFKQVYHAATATATAYVYTSLYKCVDFRVYGLTWLNCIKFYTMLSLIALL